MCVFCYGCLWGTALYIQCGLKKSKLKCFSLLSSVCNYTPSIVTASVIQSRTVFIILVGEVGLSIRNAAEETPKITVDDLC